MLREPSLSKSSICALFAIWTALCVSTAVGASPVSQTSKPAAALHGVVSGYAWATEVRHGKKAGISPCVSVSLVKRVRGSVGGKNTLCGSFSPFPLVVEEGEGEGRTTRAVVGMVFDAGIAKVRVILKKRSARNLSLRLLTKTEAKRGHVKMLRYGAIAFSGATCVVRIVPYDATGHLAKNSYPGFC
jgi:hypothetical protein